jgi:hypothetical protein
MILHVIADIIHESMINTGQALSIFLGLPRTANRAQNGASPGSQSNGSGNIEKEVSQLRGDSMKQSPSVRERREDKLTSDQEKIGLNVS